MAETKQEVVIDINIEQDDGAFKKLADLKGTLVGLKTEQKQLEKALKEGVITQKEYNSEIVRVEALQKKAAAQYSQTQRSVTGLKNPLNELNDSIKKQTGLLGGATPALDKMTGGAASAAQGIYGMVKASLAFIATPIGAVVAALGLVIGALTAYFKGSEEGQDRLTRITTVLSVAFNKMMVAVEAVGEAIFDSTANFGSMTEKLGLFGIALDISLAPLKLLLLGLEKIAELTGFDKVIDDTIKTGEAIAALNDEIEARENELIVKRSKTNAEVQALREKAITQEGDLKRKTIAEAIKLEKDLAKEERDQISAKLKAFDLEAETTGRLTEEQKKQRAELLAAQIDADAQGAQSTIKFQKELERLNDKQNALIQNRIDKEQELTRVAEEQQLQRIEKEKELYEIQVEDFKEFLEGKKAVQDEIIKVEITEEEDAEEKATVQDGIRVANEIKRDKLAAQQRLQVSQMLFAGLEQSLRAFGIKSRFISSALALVNTFLGVTEILKAPTAPFIEPFASIVRAIQIGTTIATGLGAVKQINSAQFAGGGYTGKGGKYEPAGIVHRGEVVWSQADVAAAGGPEKVNRMRPTYKLPEYATGGIVGNETRIATQQAQSQFDLNQMAGLLNMVQTVLVLEQFEAKQESVNQIQRRATVIG